MLWIRPARDSLERRVLLVAVALVIVPTFAAGLLMIRLTHQALQADHLSDADLAARLLASSIASGGDLDSARCTAA
ncbi:MAG: hypothetical protein ACOC1G_09340, partial [Phycisphaeraceae bacterium]